MLKLKRALCAVLTAVLVMGTLLASGCSTPKYAVTLDGQQYETGEYLAYLYLAYSQVMQQAQYYLYMQSMQGGSTVKDVWDLELPYGEEEDAPTLKLEAYIKQLAKDMMIRQRALENKLTEYGISPSQEDIDEVNTQLNQYGADDLLKLGISKEHFAAAYRAVQLNDNALFYGLYDGETNPEAPFMMPEEEIRKYFTDNYLSYKVIEIPLTDDDGKELSDEEKQKVWTVIWKSTTKPAISIRQSRNTMRTKRPPTRMTMPTATTPPRQPRPLRRPQPRLQRRRTAMRMPTTAAMMKRKSRIRTARISTRRPTPTRILSRRCSRSM